ncbi:MAG: PAS domain S-box protein, partial [Nitrospinae bacterium]|nr:PAS domain S-box protein [Nitrospinota bacterium]
MSSFKKERIFLIGLSFLAALMVCEALEYRQLLRLTVRNSRDQSLLLARQIGNFAHELIIRSKEGGAAIDDYLEKYEFQEGTKIRVIHSPSLNAEYGAEPDEQPETGHEKQSLSDGKPRDWETEDFFAALTPLPAEPRCRECHHLPDGSGGPVPVGYVIGLLEAKVSKKHMMAARAGLIRHKVLAAALLAFLVSTFLANLYYAERTLRESELKYRSLIETANDAIFVADADTGIISGANRKAGELLGLPVDKIVGMHQSGLPPKEEAERYKEIFQEHIRTGRAITADLFVRRGDGGKIPVDISASVCELAGKKVIQGIFHDITERRKREEKIKHSLGIEKSLSGISNIFVSNPHPDFHLVLQFLAAAIPVNRAYIFLFREKEGKMDNVHEWRDA